MKVALGTDHAGFKLKEFLKERLVAEGIEVNDVGAYEYNEGDDYPDFIFPAAEAVKNGVCERAIVIGGSGQGEAIAANKVRGIRAVVFNGQYERTDDKLSRQHNNANVLSLGSRYLTPEEALEAVTTWLATPFSDEERHARRIAKIHHYEEHGTLG